MAPRDVRGPVLRTCKYVILWDQGDFADVTQLRTLRCEDYPSLSEWAQCDHKNPYWGGEGGQWAGGLESEVEM